MKSLIISLLTIVSVICGIYFGFDWLENNNKIRKNPIPQKILNLVIAPTGNTANSMLALQNNLFSAFSNKIPNSNPADTNKITPDKKTDNISTNKKSLVTNKSNALLTLKKKQSSSNNIYLSLFSLGKKKQPESCNTEDLRLDREAKIKVKKALQKKKKDSGDYNSIFPQAVKTNQTKIVTTKLPKTVKTNQTQTTIAKAIKTIQPQTVKTNQIKTVINSVKSNELFAKTHTQQYAKYAIVIRFIAFIFDKPSAKTKKSIIFGTKLPLLETTEKSTNFTKCLLNNKPIWLKNSAIEIIPDKLLRDDLFKLPGVYSLSEAINETTKAFRSKNGNRLSKIIYKSISVHFKEKNELLIFSKADIKNITVQTILCYRKAGITFSGRAFFRLKPKATHYKKISGTNKNETAIFPKGETVQFKFRKINNRWFFTGIIVHKEYPLIH